MAKYKRKHIGGAPALAIKLLLVICVVGFAAALLTGCGAAGASGSGSSSEEDSGPSAPEEVSEGSVFVEVPGTGRGGNVFDFSYTTTNGTTVTCIVYDRSGDSGSGTVRQGAGGPFCFEEDPNGGMIAPLPRPQR